MIICRIAGGTANQILQFAAAYALARELRQELLLDISRTTIQPNGYVLDSFCISQYKKLICFDTEGEEIAEEPLELRNLLNSSSIRIYDLQGDNRRFIYKGLGSALKMKQYDSYLVGNFFDMDLYYKKYWDEIRSLLVLPKESIEIKQFKKVISNRVSVGIHIRRGDMLTVDWAMKIEDDYYKAAVTYCRIKFDNPLFMIFSDDIEYAKKLFGLDSNFYFVHFGGYDNSAINELICLSLCTHRILNNNSSYGNLADMINWAEDRIVLRRLQGQFPDSISTVEKARRHKCLSLYDIDNYVLQYSVDGKNSINNFGEIQNEIMCSSVNSENCDSLLEKIVYLEMNTYEADEVVREKLLYQKFMCQVWMQLYEDALQSAFLLYHSCADDKMFNLKLREALHAIGAYEEEQIEKQRCLGEKKYRFIIVPNKCRSVQCRTSGLVELGQVLYHLGHEVVFVYNPLVDWEKEQIRQMKILDNPRGFVWGYQGILLDTVQEQGIAEFIDSFSEENETIVISRKAEMFVKKSRLEKNVRYVFPDFSDIRDAETLYAQKHMKQDEIDDLYSLADVVLTKQKNLEKYNCKSVVWTDNESKKACRVSEDKRGLSMSHRLSKRGIGMAVALIDALD